jgi:hypothetical protein
MDLHTQINEMLHTVISIGSLKKVHIYNFQEFIYQHNQNKDRLNAAKDAMEKDKQKVCESVMRDIYELWETFYKEKRLLEQLAQDYEHSKTYGDPEREKECIGLWKKLRSSLDCILEIHTEMSTIGTFNTDISEHYELSQRVLDKGPEHLSGYIIRDSKDWQCATWTVGSDLPPTTLINMRSELSNPLS